MAPFQGHSRSLELSLRGALAVSGAPVGNVF